MAAPLAEADVDARAAEILVLEPAMAIGFERGIMVGIYRAPLEGERLATARRAFAYASAHSPRGVVFLTAFRLTPEFPIGMSAGQNRDELAAVWREVDRSAVAIAALIEFGGMRAAMMRLLTRAVFAFARPKTPFRDFAGLSDAVAWLRPRAEDAGLPTDYRTYVALYQRLDRELAALDARRRP